MRRQRKYRGKAPYGYQLDGQRTLTPNPSEAKILKLLFVLFVEHRRKGTVARLLNEKNLKTRTGAKWSDMAVGRILADPAYQQIAEETPLEDENLIIISQNLLDQVEDILGGQTKNPKRPGRAPIHLFAGKVECHCGQTMYKPSNSPKYVCKSCHNKMPIEDLEKIYLHELKPFLANSEPLRELIHQWPNLNLEAKHRIIDSTIDRVALKPGNAVEYTFLYSPFPKDVANSQQEEYPTETPPEPESTELKARRQISTRQAAEILGYHPKTLLRRASEWGLAKIHMSARTVFFFEDEIRGLQQDRSYKARNL